MCEPSGAAVAAGGWRSLDAAALLVLRDLLSLAHVGRRVKLQLWDRGTETLFDLSSPSSVAEALAVLRSVPLASLASLVALDDGSRRWWVAPVASA